MSDLTEYANLINKQTQLNNSWSAEQAQKQMDFQREMSNTAHQREIADLKAAGLNPVLSAGGQGASSPSGAMGTVDTSAVPALTEIAVQLAKAESAKAMAEMKSASGYGSNSQYYSKNTGWKLVEDLIEGFTGTSAQDAVRNLGQNINSYWNNNKTQITAGVKNIANKVATSARNVVSNLGTIVSKVYNSKLVQRLLR